MTGQGTNNDGLRQQLTLNGRKKPVISASAQSATSSTPRRTLGGKSYLLGYRYTWQLMGAEDLTRALESEKKD